jgi:hypothetical protein
MKTLISTLACAAVLAACYTSPKPQAIPQATNPYGVSGTVTLANGRTSVGELLDINDTSVVMLIDGRVASARPAAIVKVELPGARDVNYKAGRAVSAARVMRARRMTRFPYGMSPEVTAALLARTSQASPDDLEAKSP